MSTTNPFSIEFSEAELKKIDIALLMLEETFAGKLIKDAYVEAPPGGYENEIENFSSMPADEGTTLTLAMPAFVNISQWGKDEKTREQLHPIAARLKTIAQKVVCTNRAVLQRCWNSSSKY